MSRRFACCCLVVATCLTWSPYRGISQTSSGYSNIVSQYKSLSDKASHWTGKIKLRSQRMLDGKINNQFKKNLEEMFSLSPLHRLYREHANLYFKCHASLDWNLNVQPGKIQGDIVITDSYAHLTAIPPTGAIADGDVIRNLSTTSPIQHPFTLLISDVEVETNLSPFIVPQFIVDWMAPYRMWYPPLDKIGFPADEEKVRSSTQDEHSLVLVYSPQKMDNHFLLYMRELSGNPQLEFSDLTNILLLDTLTHTCRSFTVSIQSDGKQRALFSIANSEADLFTRTFPVPSVSTVMTSARIQKDKEFVWSTNFFCQTHIQSITDR